MPDTTPSPILTPQQLAELRDVRGRREAIKVGRAVKVALVDAWSIAVLAAGSLPLSLLFFDIPSILVTGGLAVVAYREFRGAAALRRLDVDAPRRLGRNQIALICLLSLYALWNIIAALIFPSGLAAAMKEMGGSAGAEQAELINKWLPLVSVAIYGTLIVVSVLAQGSLAYYYFTRTKFVQAYHAGVPAWIVQLQQSGVQV